MCMVVFYNLMNIGCINAQILYKFACLGKAQKHRRIFLKNLALTMMKEHLIFRSNVKHLPQDISAFLKVNYGREIEVITEEERCPPKRGVCRSGALEKKRTSASMKCCRCQTSLHARSILQLRWFATVVRMRIDSD